MSTLIQRLAFPLVDHYLYSLHLSTTTFLLLVLGLFILYKVFQKTKKLAHLLIGLSLLLLAVSYFNGHLVPLQYQQSFLQLPTILPLALLLGSIGLILLLARASFAFAKGLLVFFVFSSFFSSGLLFNKIIPQLTQQIPVLNQVFEQITTAFNQLGTTFEGNNSITTPQTGAVTYGTPTDKSPTQSLAQSVLTAQILAKFNQESVTYDGQGSFYINNNQSTLPAPTSSTSAYAKAGTLNPLGQLTGSSAILESSMHGAGRDTWQNTWKPVGYHQLALGGQSYLWNKGHSIGDIMLAGWSSLSADENAANIGEAISAGQWAATETNPRNVTTQSQWANQADSADTYGSIGYGQLYFEKLVLADETQPNVKIAYSVTPLYDGNNIVPSGNWIQAKSSDGKVNLNAFVPNVQPGVAIDYATGVGTIK